METTRAMQYLSKFVLLLILYYRYCDGAGLRDQYTGCFLDDQSSPIGSQTNKMIVNGLTTEMCMKRCSRLGYGITGLQDGDECHCGTDVSKGNRTDESACSIPCAGNQSTICGGSRVISVYRTCQSGKYGFGCLYDCPLLCDSDSSGDQSCDFLTGSCIHGCAKGYSHCNKSENDCFTLKPYPKPDMDTSSTRGTREMNLFPTVTFKRPGRVSSITYHAYKVGEVYFSFWRRVPDNSTQWTMVGKVQVQVTEEGFHSQVVDDNIYVSIGDALAIHYPLNNESTSRRAVNVISYQKVYSFRSEMPDGLSYLDYKPLYKLRLFDNGWKRWQSQNFVYITSERRIPLVNISVDCFQDSCPDHKYGPECSYDCLPTCKDRMCSSTNGECIRGCVPGFMGSHCFQRCPGYCKQTNDCDRFSGTCSSGICANGYTGELCDKVCSFQQYGENCSLTCHCAGGNGCDHVTGKCPEGEDQKSDACEEGWTGCSCSVPIHNLRRNNMVLQILTPILIVLLIIAVATIVYLQLKIKYGFSLRDSSCCRKLSTLKLGSDIKGVRFSNPLSIPSGNMESFNGDEISANHSRERQPSNGK